MKRAGDEAGASPSPAVGTAAEVKDVARLEAALRDARATITALRSELAKRDEDEKALHAREAYRFARTLVDVKGDRWQAWRLPLAALALLTPQGPRERARRAVARLAAPAKGRLLTLLASRLPGAVARELRKPHAQETPWPGDAPLVSVVIPCFNYGRFVREAVDSVLAQTLQDLEIVVVEGGSTDGETPALVRALDDPRVRKVFQPRPTRVGENRLAGLKEARGKYAVFLDADDLLAPTYLEKAVLALELTGVDLVYPSVELFGREAWVWETGAEFTLAGMLVANTVPTVAMFRTESWRTLDIGYGTDPDLELEDYDFWLRFAVQGARALRIREPLMRYRVHGTSMTDALRHRYEEVTAGIHARHGRALRRSRVALLTALQRDTSFRAGRAANLARLQARGAASLRVAIANPFLVVGGSDHLLQQVFADHAARDASLLVYATQEAPASMGSSAADYAALTPDVFELPNELPPAAHPDAILHLLRSRGAQILLLVGSRATYELLPRIKRELPHLRVVDHLYNAVGHLASNREFAAHVDFHIVANEEVRRALLDAGEVAERIEVIHHGIDPAAYDPARIARCDALEGLDLDPGEQLVLFAGRLSQEKGVLRFLDIAARLRHPSKLRFAIIGDGPMRAAARARAAELGLERRVPMLGFVRDPRPYLRRADAVVIPSDVDGLPLVSLEALALGTPVVASRVGALPEVVEPGLGAVVDAGDVDGFVRALADVLALDRGATEARCRESAVRRFGIEQVRERYYRVFRRLVAEAGAPRAGAKEVA